MENIALLWDREKALFIAKTKINGRTVKVEFQCDESDSTFFWNIYLVCYNKRKDENFNLSNCKTTGQIGIKALLFAKKAILQFEREIEENRSWSNKKNILLCRWTDNQRRRVYEYGLKPLGFYFDIIEGQKALIKIISKKKK